MLAKQQYDIIPSLLSADLTRLGEEIEALLATDTTVVHLDIMDNHYVPNLTFGPMFCHAIHQRFPTLDIDVHLMTSTVDQLIQEFAQAGASRIGIHPDSTHHLDRSLQQIRELGCQAGLVLNPATSTDQLRWCQQRLDYVLIMTVNPGFAGQRLIPSVKDKIAWVHQQYPQLPICVDGGITIDNIDEIAQLGATQFVAGSAVFGHPPYHNTITAMRQKLRSS